MKSNIANLAICLVALCLTIAGSLQRVEASTVKVTMTGTVTTEPLGLASVDVAARSK